MSLAIRELDNEVASFIVKYFLTHKKLDLEIVKSKFGLDHRAIRESLIRLYFSGKSLGKIENNFLEFTSGHLALEDMLDEPLSNYPLDKLIHNNIDVDKSSDYSNMDETQLLSSQLKIQSSSEIVFSRSRELDQKSGISVETRFGFAGYKLKMKISIRNNSSSTINNCKMKLNYPPSLSIVSLFPNLDKVITGNSVSISFGSILANNLFNIAILFHHEGQPRISVEGILQYNTEDGFARLMKIEPTSSEFILPTFTAGSLTPEMIKMFMKSEAMKRHILAFGAPKNLSDTQCQLYMERIVEKLGFLLVSRIQKESMSMAFFSGKAETPTHEYLEILVVPQVKNRIMEIYAAGLNDEVIVSLLRVFGFSIEQALIQDNILSPTTPLIDLNCVNCGAVLTKNPAQYEEVNCKFCRTSQIPWS